MRVYFSRDYRGAVDAAKRAIRSCPDYPNTDRRLAAALGRLDQRREAAEASAKAVEVAPGAFDMYIHTRPLRMRPEDRAHVLGGLRKAGLAGQVPHNACGRADRG